MRIEFAALDTCATATGTVVVVDVLRAFTTAAYAFAAGAQEIMLVSSVDEALALRERFAGALTMGELHGLAIPEFDFGNSPVEIEKQDLHGRRLIQRTSAATLLAASFSCARATARCIARQAPESVTFVITGIDTDRDGDDDRACAEYLVSLLEDERANAAPFLERVRASDCGRWFAGPAHPELPVGDLDRAVRADWFNHALLVTRRDGLLIMQPVPA